MNIVKITVQRLEIPFNDSFCHASAERQQSDSIIVGILLDDGTTGYGEGCPRSYVTGESSQYAAEFIHQVSSSIMSSVHDIDSLRYWITANDALINNNPAAWCGLELAIIDALAKSRSVSAGVYFDVELQTVEDLKYTAVLSGGSTEKLSRYMKAYVSFQFDDFKIKLTGDLDLDIDRISLFNRLSPGSRLRLDANNLWTNPVVAAIYLKQLPEVFFAIEEPLAAKDFSGLQQLSQLIPQKIVLDESFTSIKDFDFLLDDRERFILNVRVSKLGGLIRSKLITDMAETSGVPYIIGAHVGETSILTRAAMMLGRSNAKTLVAREGAAGEYLLSRDICLNSIMFGRQGLYRDKTKAFGVGYEINHDELSKYACLKPDEINQAFAGNG